MTVCLYVFPTLLSEVTKQHPGVDVKIMSDSTDRCIQHLRAGTGDIAMLTLPIRDADMVTVPVLQEELLVVTSAKHPLSKKRRVNAQDLATQPFVLFEQGSNTRRVVDEFFASSGIEPRIVMETENVEILKALVRHGLGITIVSYQSVARDVASGHLYCARIDGRPLIRETGWVYPKMSRTPRAVDEVIKAFEKVRPRLRLAP
jgi:DNA-binding transcriptional LysR family regulator